MGLAQRRKRLGLEQRGQRIDLNEVVPQPAVPSRDQTDRALVHEHCSAHSGPRAREVEIEPSGAGRTVAGRRRRPKGGKDQASAIIA
jgi:hypothetical protein